MSRQVSVWFPAFPIDRLGRALERSGAALPWLPADTRPAEGRPSRGSREIPFALVENGPRGLTLTAVNAAASDKGVRPGRTLADARAALPTLATCPAEPGQDRAALLAAATWAGRYGPNRNVEGRDGLWIDITGVAHLLGGEEALAGDIVRGLARAGFGARVGLADTHGAAHALARFSGCDGPGYRIAAPGKAAEALAPLPVEALRLAPDAAVLLRRLGLKRIGQLYGLPREALAQRFRSGVAQRASASKRAREALLMAGSVLIRLDQALGRTREPRAAMEEPPVHRVQQLFAEPLISADGVSSAVLALARALEHLLAERSEGGTRFALGIYGVDGSARHIRIGTSAPSRHAGHLAGLFAPRLEEIDAGFGIDALTLAAVQVEPLAHRQVSLTAGEVPAAEETAALLDRLSNRLGGDRVGRVELRSSHVPERAERRVPVLSGAPQPSAAREPAPSHRPPRPAFLLSPPEPIAVLAEVPEGPPLRFTWRRLTRRVVRASGPERIAPEWWRGIGRAEALSPRERQLERPRDYYAIEDEGGGRYWVFRAGLYGGHEEEVIAAEPAWFMHGAFG